jgi:predicted flap endonuclease-1-like 5' DNA nuclease
MQQENQVPEVNTWFPEAVFWIVQDWRSQYLRCSCAGCGPDLGIRLARVWMWRHADRQGRQKCQVLYIDAYSPFRRRIANECWPTRPESIGLQQFIWEVADSACAPLRRLGLGAISLERLQFRSTGQFAEQLKSEVMFVSCWDRSQTDSLIGYYYPDICGHTRIVHFAARAADQKPAREISTLPADHPDLDLRTVNGIGDGIAKRLKAKGYANIVALAAASPEEIHKALASMPINPPDEERSARYVKDAQARLEQLQKGE